MGGEAGGRTYSLLQRSVTQCEDGVEVKAEETCCSLLCVFLGFHVFCMFVSVVNSKQMSLIWLHPVS